MDTQEQKMLKNLSPTKMFLPILVGLGVLFYMIWSDDSINLDLIIESLGNMNLFWVFLSFVVLFGRDIGYMYRIRTLTNNKLDWNASFFVIMLWEFASAITPSVVGGTSVAVFIMNREKIPFGKSLSFVMLTAILDNMFFVVASLLVIALFPGSIFPSNDYSTDLLGFTLGLPQIFAVSVSLIAFYTAFMAWGLFIGPKSFKKFLWFLTSFSFTKRWRRMAVKSGNEMVVASKELKGHTSSYWVKVILSTVFIWSARYAMLNCLINAFLQIDIFNLTTQDILDQFLIFGRQIIMWIVMLISPTPGSAGTAEYFFGEFFREFFKDGGIVLVVALFWRLFTYYTYLLIGAIVLPRWIQKRF
ncbi:lysylphosphatidylglycerol synthase transmembrane domain-containing protein [Flammeovirga sp. SubArs3]|uniref:lysylphosphatidylglycerol synthase transmembrane domain-containing protein n=1 Tax=Flammeovirga sp. SubArs3 TaxID=2995316 RepID=UPI00248C4249|nr:lysylphosphatidylglycerol synthase transmembrane domain-containing protein [Flammeovirga sp. SubArs3]